MKSSLALTLALAPFALGQQTTTKPTTTAAAPPVAPTPAAGDDLMALLSDPKYNKFIQIVLSDAPICITDKAVADGSFDLTQCPEIDTLLNAVQEADTTGTAPDVALQCSAACEDEFLKLGDACRTAIINGILNSDNEYIAGYGQDFFGTCTGLTGNVTAPVASVPMPAEVPVPAPIEVLVPMPVEVPTPAPAPVEVPTPAPAPVVVPPPALPPAAGAIGDSYAAAGSVVLGVVLAMI